MYPMKTYQEFLADKRRFDVPSGLDIPESAINPMLFGFQRDTVRWALKRGRASIFWDCGLGKSPAQLEWARHVPGPVLILAPLAVSGQTKREGDKFGVQVTLARKQSEAGEITVTNYEMLDHFDPSKFAGVVLDESSILKSYTGSFRTQIIESFARTPYKLACTATPAPNDFMELGNHAEFMGTMTRTEMLSMFFVHDGGETQSWRLKGHAVGDFWRWVCSWAVMARRPSDLGYSDDGFDLPPITYHHHTNETFPVSEWQKIASPIRMDINPNDTLQKESAREEEDERHICPLQLEVIRRALRLWSNPNDLVLSPFAGIGSEGHVAIEMGRRFVGAELKRSYFDQAVLNLRAAVHDSKQASLFSQEIA